MRTDRQRQETRRHVPDQPFAGPQQGKRNDQPDAHLDEQQDAADVAEPELPKTTPSAMSEAASTATASARPVPCQ